MPNSPSSTTNPRLCDFCNQSTALLFCRPDSAKLCLSCDRKVHSTNPLFTKHTRSLLCDRCHSSPASIFCSTDSIIHCHNCDWETHNNNNNKSSSHDRRPIEGFSGCPSVGDLMGVLGFDDLGFGSGYGYGDGDCLVWESPGFVNLDDLIVGSGEDYGFQAMGVPPLPKNRNAAFGAYKDELLYQLRELAKSEPNVGDGQDIVKPINEFPLTPNFELQCRSLGFEHMFEENVNSSQQTNAFQWCPDSCDAEDPEFYSDQVVGHKADENCIVPDEKSIDVHNLSRINDNAENTQIFHGVSVRELNSQERESALTRYKEKKKSRRYDKQIRYESRKVRAESRTRIKGRFAKMSR